MSSGDFCGMGLSHAIFSSVKSGVSPIFRALERRNIREMQKSAVGLVAEYRPSDVHVALLDRSYASTTAAVYKQKFAGFLKWKEQEGLGDMSLAVSRYLGVQEKHDNPATVRLQTAALRTVLDRILLLNATEGITYPRPPPERPAATMHAAQTLFDLCNTAEDLLLLFFLHVLTLRPGQIRMLRIGDFNFRRNYVDVCFRRNRRKLCTISSGACKFLQKIFSQMKCEDSYLFPSKKKRGHPVTVRCLQQRLFRLGRKGGIAITCTALRKADLIPIFEEMGEDLPPAGENSVSHGGNQQPEKMSIFAFLKFFASERGAGAAVLLPDYSVAPGTCDST